MSKRLISYIFRNKISLFSSLIFAFVSSGLTLLTPYYTGKAIDNIIGEGNVDFNNVMKIIVLLLLMFIVSGLFQWCVTSISTSIAYKTTCEIRKDAFDKINRMPIAFFDKTPLGDIMSRLTNDIDAVSDGLLQGMTQLFMGVITIVGSIIIMFKMNILITIVILIITPVAFLVSAFIAKRISKYFTDQSKVTGELNSLTEEMITNTKIVKAYSFEDKNMEKFKKINRRLYTSGQKAQWYSSLINPTIRLINNFVYILVGIMGGFLALYGPVSIGGFQVSGVMTVGLIASFLSYASQFARPINDITGVSTQIQSATASLKRIFAIVDMESENDNELQVLDVKYGSVEFRYVSFSYDKEKELIKNLSFSVAPSSVVAIVGTTGAGKTTLVNLLMRFYELDSGKILIDGTDIANVTKDSLRTSFAMVLQEAVLFDGTIAENISYGVPDATREQVINAAKSAHVHRAIMSMKNGYDTVISGDSEELSAGQKQLITISRAMMLNPKMLILDEATSSVDTLTEIYIQRGFEKMMAGKTTFIIAHRLSTIKNADMILVMDKGNVVERGTHQELLQNGKFYADLYESQFKNN